MPYKVRKHGRIYQILRADTGEVKGRSETKEKAMASVRARYANESGYGGKK